MALTPQTVDVPLSVLSQIEPKTSGPIGRLTHLIDSEVVRFTAPRVVGTPTAVRVDKRSGFSTLSDTVRTTVDGAISVGATLDSQTLLTEFADRLVLVSNDKTHVYSDTTAAWEKHDYQLPVDTLTQSYVHTSNTLATTPDMAHAEGVSCYAWVNEADHNAGGGSPSELAGCYFTIVDADGVTLRSDTRLNPTDTRVKVVSDGSVFWIVSDKGDGTGTVKVRVVDRYGLDLATTTFAVTGNASDPFDVVSTSFGVLVAQPTSTGVQFSKLSYASGSITRTANADTSIAGNHRIAFLTNDVDGYAYLATVDHVGTDDNDVYAYRITSGLVQTVAYAVATNEADEIANITGYVVPGSSGDLVVSFSIIDDTAAPNTDPMANVIREYYAPIGGTATFTKTLRAMNLASRAFAIRGRYYYVGYYPSEIVSALSGAVELVNQPTYFLCPLNNLTQNTAGRFEYGIAYAEWQTSGSKYRFALPSCVATFPSGYRVPLSYRAESFTSTRLQVNGDISQLVRTQATTVGVKAFSFGPDYGRSVAYGTDILLPGPVATTWSGGEFSESNVNLAFEPPTAAVTSTVGTDLTPGTYQYVVVAEWTDQNGNRVRSLPSPPLTVQVVTSGKYVALKGRMLHATNKSDVLISIYRTDMVPDSGGGYVTTTQHYKITVDAPTDTDAPLYNDDNQSIWQFDDAHTTITANEILYTDKGQLANYPAPPFYCGAVWKDRVFVATYDNSIWFSAQQTEGDGLWFHPAFRIVLPTNDRIKALATMDDYLLVLCASSLWYVPLSGPLPDSAGANGNIPSAVQLPFKQGCTGQAVVTRDGCVYSSSANGLWLITRSLENLWLGEAAADALDGPVSALTIDAKQRIYAVVGAALVVYDSISRCFYEWSTPDDVQLMATWQGAPVFGDGNLVWQQLDGTYSDVRFQNDVQTVIPYFSSVSINFMHLGGVRNYKRLWATQFIGTTHTASTVTVDVSYDDDTTVLESKSFSTSPSQSFAYELKPKKQLCSSIAFTITESLTGSQVPGRGFSLELLSFSLGLEPRGLNRLPTSNRI